MQLLQLSINTDGKYHADIDITKDEWITMLKDNSIFNENCLNMVLNWYKEPNHLASCHYMQLKYFPEYNASPYNSYCVYLGKRITKYLNRFEIKGLNTKRTFFIIPFEGWYDKTCTPYFIWKLRHELVEAIEELGLVDQQYLQQDEELESIVLEHNKEGKKITYYTTKYERNTKNRNAAIRIHKPICAVCGFDFEKVYGQLGHNFIEVHHTKPLYTQNQEIEINPYTDLVCICSNCHRMIHRYKDSILTVTDLQQIMKQNT